MQTVKVTGKVEIKLFVLPNGEIAHTLDVSGDWSTKHILCLALIALLKNLIK